MDPIGRITDLLEQALQVRNAPMEFLPHKGIESPLEAISERSGEVLNESSACRTLMAMLEELELEETYHLLAVAAVGD